MLMQYYSVVETYSWTEKKKEKLIEELRHKETFELINLESGKIISPQATLK